MIKYVEAQIKARETKIESLERHIKEEKRQLALWQRQKWWLSKPDVAYFKARTTWETERYTQEFYLDFYVSLVMGKDGTEIDFHSEPLFFYDFPTLQEDVLDDDEQFTKYENPYLCT